MKKSCKYCGFIHDFNYKCPKRVDNRDKYKKNEIDRFRSSYAWQRKREEIKQRDLYMCVICRDINTGNNIEYNSNNISVHHIVPIKVDYNKRFNNNNLITLCDKHHKQAENGTIKASYLKELIKK